MKQLMMTLRPRRRRSRALLAGGAALLLASIGAQLLRPAPATHTTATQDSADRIFSWPDRWFGADTTRPGPLQAATTGIPPAAGAYAAPAEPFPAPGAEAADDTPELPDNDEDPPSLADDDSGSDAYADSPLGADLPDSDYGETPAYSASYSVDEPNDYLQPQAASARTVAASRAATASTARPAARRLRELAPAPQADLPRLTIEAHVYHADARRRLVVVNGQRYAEADVLAEGPRVAQIVEEGVVMEWRGERFLLTLRSQRVVAKAAPDRKPL
ncbi:hypothetical protein D0B54_04670 [Solimonas sp. K1W22B-7]|uniref:general secretion pathway protein GspB n=1 Tax=Solimonas sp. K1W22B-7 TaxID=2303331 RepID=UPI000E32EA41|nr:general secretion pathway protein GspB [Solimonas sp. K1W22B-7]AXQ28007.1 hypothetical protein D0B54_04670 [Solimonas sp. K1W22B-7]